MRTYGNDNGEPYECSSKRSRISFLCRYFFFLLFRRSCVQPLQSNITSRWLFFASHFSAHTNTDSAAYTHPLPELHVRPACNGMVSGHIRAAAVPVLPISYFAFILSAFVRIEKEHLRIHAQCTCTNERKRRDSDSSSTHTKKKWNKFRIYYFDSLQSAAQRYVMRCDVLLICTLIPYVRCTLYVVCYRRHVTRYAPCSVYLQNCDACYSFGSPYRCVGKQRQNDDGYY